MTQETLLARFAVLHELGRGATGAVYAVRDRKTGAVVALKRLDPALLDRSAPGFADEFLKRTRSAARLKHPNIVAIHDAGKAGGTVYVAMERLEGESLRKILDAGPLPVARAVRIVHDVARGLAHAHLQGVVHGAIKPSNVIVLPSGVAKITDFGGGQAAPGYQAPEQLQGGPVDHRSDLFSLGALLYEVLTHRPPPKPITGKPPLPSELNPHVPRALDKIVLAMLAAQPAARMAGVPILLGELQRLEEGLGLAPDASASPPKPQEPPQPKPPRAETPAVPAAIRHRPRTPERAVSDAHAAMATMERESRRQRPPRSRRAAFAALAVMLAAAGIGFTGMLELPDLTLASFMEDTTSRMRRTPETPRPAVPARAPVPAPVAETPKEPAPMLAAAPPSPPPPVVNAQVDRQSQPEQIVTSTPTEAKPAESPELQPAPAAQLIVAISPRGELYVDGKHQGTTPPTTTFALEPGMRRIEVRSGSRKPFLTYMTVQPGDVRRIRHDFDAKPSAPPTRKRVVAEQHPRDR